MTDTITYRLYPCGSVYMEDDFAELDQQAHDDYGTYSVPMDLVGGLVRTLLGIGLPKELIQHLIEEELC